MVDEAYIEFVRDQACARSVEYLDNDRPLVTLRTFSKVYGLAEASDRIWALCRMKLANLIEQDQTAV